MTTTAKLTCLDAGADCSGPVEYRLPLSATRRAFPHCEAHWEKRLHFDGVINRGYARSARERPSPIGASPPDSRPGAAETPSLGKGG